MSIKSKSVEKGTPSSHTSPIINDQQGAVFYLVTLVIASVVLLQTFVMQGVVPGMTEPRLTGIVALLLFAAIAAYYRLTGHLKFASVLLVAVAYAGATYASFKNGGSPAPTLNYFPFLPIATTVLLGRTAGVISLCASIVAVIFCTYTAQTGLATTSPHTIEELRLLLASGCVLLAIGVTAYATIYETLISKAVDEAEEAKRQVEQKADALEQSQKFLATVMDATHDAIIASDASGKLSIFNRAARELHGIDAQPLDSQDWPSTYNLLEADGETPMKFENVPLFCAMQGNKVVGRQIAIATPGRDVKFMTVNAAPLYNEKKELIGAVATMRDITTEHYQNEKIRSQNREIDHFARVASLDLQAPLNRIIMTSEALIKSPEIKASAKNRTDLAAVTAAARKMGALIKDVLYMSRLPIGEISLQPVSARDCIEAAIDLADLSEADCRLDFRFTGSHDVMADPQSLTHVFKNLIENAWKHSTPGIRAHAEFTCIVDEGSAVLGVKDNGPGMPPEQIDKLFTPLERLRTDDDADGTGLGLAICRKSVTRMGGEFWVESETGQGCHFRIRLPLAVEQEKIAS